jgi:DNA primase
MSVTQEIKNRLDIVDVIQDAGVQLRKSGHNWSGFCPFHHNTRTPAFYVFPDSQGWYCFGACSEGGDVFSFVMKKNGWDFKEALTELAGRANVTLEEYKPKDAAREAAEARQAALLDAASLYFHQLLLHAPQAEAARRYINERALNEETVAAFRLGFALDSWDGLKTHFTAQGYSEDELLATGLLTEHDERRTRYDRFRNRLVIPIRDLEGAVVGFGARTLDPDGIPKYLNSPQTMLFDKGRLIFGLDMAKRYIREAREVVLVEGYMDVMQAWQHGYRNVVAQMGTSLTEAQLRLLQKQTKRFILALDPDAAGAKATLRSLQLARETLDRDLEVRFDARGLVQLEGRLKAEFRVVTLPEGQDPDKFIRNDPVAWPRLLAGARPVVDYVIQVVTAELEPGDAKGKSAAATQVLPLIYDIPDPVERDHYLHQLSETLGVDVNALLQAQNRLRQQQKRPPAAAERRANGGQSASPPIPDEPPDDMPAAGRSVINGSAGRVKRRRFRRPSPLEENFIRQCLLYPGAFNSVNLLLSRHKQPEVNPGDFTVAEDRALIGEIAHRATQPTVATIDELCDSLDSVLAERVRMLLTRSSMPESKLDRLPDTLARSVLDWRLEKIREQNAVLQQLLAAEAVKSSREELAQLYSEQVKVSKDTMRNINLAKNAMSAMGRRRAEEDLTNRRIRA